MRFFIVLLAAVFATVSAFPQNWAVSSMNSKKSCVIPVGFKPAPGAMMSVTNPTVDAKNGPHCKITIDKATNIITVTSDVAPRGAILSVTAGTLAKGIGAKKNCATTTGAKTTFMWTPAPGAKASATCGDSETATMYTTLNVPLN